MRRAVAVVLVLSGLSAAFALVACATGPYLELASREQRPEWLERTPYQLGGKRYYVGRSTGALSSEDALQLARADAVRALVQQLGVTVSEESLAHQEESDGQFSYDVQLQVTARSEPVKIRNMTALDRYVETWHRAGREFDGWVLMMLPEADYVQARRAAAGRVLVVWECDAEPRTLCIPSLIEGIQEVVTAAGRPLVPEVILGPVKSDLSEVGMEREAAFVLHIAISGSFTSEMEGEFYAQGSATARLIDTGEQKVVRSFETGPLKGGHFSREQAVMVALRDAAKALAAQMVGQL